MTVEIWYFERSDKPHEKGALLHLARELNALSEPFLMICNPILYGQEIDALVLKERMIFVVEVKSADGPITGKQHGPWTVQHADGHVSVMNDGRDRNPFEQIQREYRFTLDFLNANVNALMTASEAAQNDFRKIKNVLIVDPDYDPALSDIDLGKRDRWLNIVGLHNDVAEPFWRLEHRQIVISHDQAVKLARDVLCCQRDRDMEQLIGIAPDPAPTAAPPEEPGAGADGGAGGTEVPPAAPASGDEPDPGPAGEDVGAATANAATADAATADAATADAATADAATADVTDAGPQQEEGPATDADIPDAADADAASAEEDVAADADAPPPVGDEEAAKSAFREAETEEWIPPSPPPTIPPSDAVPESSPLSIFQVADEVIAQVKGTLRSARSYFEIQRNRWREAHPLEFGDLLYALRETADANLHQLLPEVIVPNYYQVALTTKEYARIEQLRGRYQRRLAEDLQKHILSQGYVFDEAYDRLVVEIIADSELQDRVAVQPAFRAISPVATLTGQRGQTLQLFPGDQFSIGRGENVDWSIPDPNDYPVASREHLSVSVPGDGQCVVIMDAGSKNGTWVKGEKVTRMTTDEDCEILLGRIDAEIAGPWVYLHFVTQEAEI